AALADLDGRRHVDLDEAAQGLDQLAHLRAGRGIGCDRRTDGDAAGLGDLAGDIADAQDVEVAVLAREAQLGGQVLADMVVTERPPSSISFTRSALAIVDLPEPERPVNSTVKPCSWRGGCARCSSAMTSGNENQLGSSSPSWSRRRSSVPLSSSTVSPGRTS